MTLNKETKHMLLKENYKVFIRLKCINNEMEKLWFNNNF